VACTTGRASSPSESTWIPAGINTRVAAAAMARESRPPRGKPMNTLARMVRMSSADQFSSTPPEEKKNTSYGVIAAPNRAIA